MHLITAPLPGYAKTLAARQLSVDRPTLAKRRWRLSSQDGLDFGFDLAEPLRHGEVFFVTPTHRYEIDQIPELVLAIQLKAILPAARIGWQIGNLHFPIAFADEFILAENDLAIRQLLEREHIPFQERWAVFAPLAPTPGSGHHHHH